MRKLKLKDLEDNQSTFWYQTYEGETDELDEDGKRTGDKIESYSNPIEAKAMITASNGNAENSPFGKDIVYDKSMSTVQNLPIDEYTKLFIDVRPVIQIDGSTDTQPDYSCVCTKNGLEQNVWALRKIKGGKA